MDFIVTQRGYVAWIEFRVQESVRSFGVRLTSFENDDPTDTFLTLTVYAVVVEDSDYAGSVTTLAPDGADTIGLQTTCGLEAKWAIVDLNFRKLSQ